MTIDEKLRTLRDIVQVDIGNRGLARNAHHNLFNAFPNDFADACRSIAEQPRPEIAIVTGFWIADAQPPGGETDGPLGAVYLARAFQELGPIKIITDPFCGRALNEGVEAAGLRDFVKVVELRSASVSSDVYFKTLLLPLVRTCTHIISIERVGPARDDRCYSMRGRDITDFMYPAHLLFENPAEYIPDVITIGIGDGGNEIGMGKMPIGTIECNIPNGPTIACRVPTDHLIVAGISNWGAYALAAGVALLRDETPLPALFNPQYERQLLQRMVECGPLVDGKTGLPTVTVDGIEFEEYIRPLYRIREIVEARVQ